jgi:uncharacterized protein YjbI with pentapeptide repeats
MDPLRKADLSMAEVNWADLWAADLRWADLQLADLREADLRRVNLSMANLSKADLREANFEQAALHVANLSGAKLIHAYLSHTTFGDTNLAGVKGLESCEHSAPSSVGIDTLSRSNGHIPDVFLRVCGLRDWEIEAARLYRRGLSVTEMTDICYRMIELGGGQPLQYYSCFISYTAEDETFANRLYDDLQNEGVRCWFAPHHMRGGRKIHEQISEAIQFQDKVLLILSAQSMASNWVQYEVMKARNRELLEKRRLLFPIGLAPFEALQAWEYFDADTATDLAAEIRSYFIPDFSQWKDRDSYQQAFARLLRDLQTAAAATG